VRKNTRETNKKGLIGEHVVKGSCLVKGGNSPVMSGELRVCSFGELGVQTKKNGGVNEVGKEV